MVLKKLNHGCEMGHELTNVLVQSEIIGAKEVSFRQYFRYCCKDGTVQIGKFGQTGATMLKLVSVHEALYGAYDGTIPLCGKYLRY